MQTHAHENTMVG